MAYCPCCGEAIDKAASNCKKCGAIFGVEGGWGPIELKPSVTRITLGVDPGAEFRVLATAQAIAEYIGASRMRRAVAGIAMSVVLGLLILIALLAVIDPWYFPSRQERSAKDQVLKTVQKTYGKLPALHKVDPRSGDFVEDASPDGAYALKLQGNYYAQEATLDARYYVYDSGSDVCDSFLRAIKEDSKWLTISHRGECRKRQYDDRTLFSIDARRTDHATQGLIVDITEPAENPARRWRTVVVIHIYHTLHAKNWHSCSRDNPSIPTECNSAYWFERWTPTQKP